MTVIPAINAATFAQAREQFAKILALYAHLPAEEFMHDGWVHIDVADGTFTANRTWDSPEELRKLTTENLHSATVKVEVHLMVKHPETSIEAWLKAGVRRIIVQAECAQNFDTLREMVCDRHGAELMVSVAPETDPETLAPHLPLLSYMQVLAVVPGLAGQRFDERAVGTIKFLRARAPHVMIEVDGGINPDTARRCKEAGADIAVSASYILTHPDPYEAYRQLRAI